MNIPWNPDGPAIRKVQIRDGGLCRFCVYNQTPTGWTFSGVSYMVNSYDPDQYIPEPVRELLLIKRRLGGLEPVVYYYVETGEILPEEAA